MSLWEYEVSVLRPERDVVAHDVEATDGSTGRVVEATNDAASSYLVVDTGFWIFVGKRLIPAEVIVRVDDEERTVFVSSTLPPCFASTSRGIPGPTASGPNGTVRAKPRRSLRRCARPARR